jgi:hypothetical protein
LLILVKGQILWNVPQPHPSERTADFSPDIYSQFRRPVSVTKLFHCEGHNVAMFLYDVMVAIHAVHYNFARIHKTLWIAPAMGTRASVVVQFEIHRVAPGLRPMGNCPYGKTEQKAVGKKANPSLHAGRRNGIMHSSPRKPCRSFSMIKLQIWLLVVVAMLAGSAVLNGQRAPAFPAAAGWRR